MSVKDANNHTISYGYDALGRRTTVTDAKNNVFTTVYDGNGNVLRTVDAKGNTVSETVYNCLNLPDTVIDSTGKTTSYVYNELGKVYTATDSMGRVQEFLYDPRGRNTSVKDVNNMLSTAQYDFLGNITRLAGPLGGATNYTYDNMGRLVSESTSSGGTKNYEYNELNIREKVTNARGQIRQISHDAMGRITGYTCPEGIVAYTYDANGNVLTVSDNNGTITRVYDDLNRVTRCTDTYGNVIRYEYDNVGNLSRIVYPDSTAVSYAYDENNNLIRVTDWANRITSYTYDVNNRVVGVVKPDGSVTTTVYDNKQRVTSTVERTSGGTVITGFEYTYDTLSNIVEEKCLANNTKMCYTYDSLNRVTKRRIYSLSNNSLISEEEYSYDAAGNITDAPDNCFSYDTNNRLVVFDGNSVSYDLDGNMLSNGMQSFTYDSANRLITAGGHAYIYNAEDVRIRNVCDDAYTTYVYDTNCRLSQLLTKTTDGVVTKYVYGLGLIGEETSNSFKTYHFDFRGSTVAITNANGQVTDTFKYDTYGNVIERTGNTAVIFGYNGRDGVVTDANGLIYMRARYYSPEMKRFVNADIIAGEISNAVTLNRYAYANGNPVSNIDPFGLSPDEGRGGTNKSLQELVKEFKQGESNKTFSITSGISFTDMPFLLADAADSVLLNAGKVKFVIDGDYINIHGHSQILYNDGITQRRIKSDNLNKYTNIAKYANAKEIYADAFPVSSGVVKSIKAGKNVLKVSDFVGVAGDVFAIGFDTAYEVSKYDSSEDKWIVGGYTVATGAVSATVSTAASATAVWACAKIGSTFGTAIYPGIGTAVGLVAGIVVGAVMDFVFDVVQEKYIDDIVENN